MITVTILALVLVYKSFCNTVCIYMVMQIKLVVVVVVVRERSPRSSPERLFSGRNVDRTRTERAAEIEPMTELNGTFQGPR